MKIDIKIYGIHERDFLIDKLKERLELKDEDILYDEREKRGSCLYGLGNACSAPIPEGLTHRLVMPDDMIVCENFKVILNKIIRTHPNAVVSLWPFQFNRYAKFYKPMPTPYFKDNGVACGNGVILPVEYLKPMVEWWHSEHPMDYDTYRSEYAMMAWIKTFAVPLIITVPSPVQHIGDDYGSHLPYKVTINRKSVFFKEDCLTGVNWESKEIMTFCGNPRYLNDRIMYFQLPREGLFEEEKAFNPRNYKKEG